MLDQKYRVRVNRDLIPNSNRSSEKSKKWLKYGLIGAGVIVVVIVILIIIGIRKDKEPQAEGAELSLVVERGAVQVKLNEESDFEDADDGMLIPEGATVRTEQEGLVSLELSTGGVVRLNENSRLEIETINAENFSAKLVGGQAWNHIGEEGTTPQTINTLEATIKAQSTTFDVEHGSDQTIVRSIEDEVEITAQKNSEDSETEDSEANDSEQSDSSQAAFTLEEGRQTTLEANNLPVLEADYPAVEISKEFTDSFWYRWNTEKDKEYELKLSGDKDKEGPELEITAPEDGDEVDSDTVEVKGRTEISATVEINGKSVDNNLGEFSSQIDLQEGENKITVIVEDSAGNKTEEEITVNRVGKEPDVVDIWTETNAPGEITIFWSMSEADDFAQYTLYRDDVTLQSFSDSTVISYTDSGLGEGASHSYRVCVTDKDGLEACSPVTSATTTSAPNATPSVGIANPGGGASFDSGETVSFKAVGEDADGDTLTYAWDFGDGATASGQSTSHSFKVTKTTTFNVKVTVTDTKGATASSSVNVKISP